MVKEVRVVAFMTDPVLSIGVDAEALRLVVDRHFAVFNSVDASLAVEGWHLVVRFAFDAF